MPVKWKTCCLHRKTQYVCVYLCIQWHLPVGLLPLTVSTSNAAESTCCPMKAAPWSPWLEMTSCKSSQQHQHSSKPSKPICLARTPGFQHVLSCLPHMLQFECTMTCSVAPSTFRPFCVIFNHCYNHYLLLRCWRVPSRALLPSSLLSQWFCEALPAQFEMALSRNPLLDHYYY